MKKTFGIILIGVLAFATGLGITWHKGGKTQEQAYCEHSSEQGALNPKIIGWAEESESLGAGVSLEELLESGKLEDGDSIFCGKRLYNFEGEKVVMPFHVQYSNGNFIYPELNERKTEMVDAILPKEELGRITGLRIDYKKPIINRDYWKN